MSERGSWTHGEREKKQRPAEMGAVGKVAVLSGAKRESLNLWTKLNRKSEFK